MRIVDQIDGWQLLLYLILISGTALPATIFSIAYGLLTRWWESSFGRFMMYMGTAIALILDLTAARIWLPPFPVWVSVFIYTLIFIMTWWCLILFLRTWYREHKSHKMRERRLRTVAEEDTVENGV